MDQVVLEEGKFNQLSLYLILHFKIVNITTILCPSFGILRVSLKWLGVELHLMDEFQQVLLGRVLVDLDALLERARKMARNDEIVKAT